MSITPDNLPDDLTALKRIIAAMALDAATAQAEIARLKFQLARYRRVEFGRSSEKLAREVEQLELALEALETDQAERLATASPSCGGALRKIGDEVSETLDYVPGRFKVVRHIREKLSCRVCDTVVAAPAPDLLLAHASSASIVVVRENVLAKRSENFIAFVRRGDISGAAGRTIEGGG